jgi:hypothetical protein
MVEKKGNPTPNERIKGERETQYQMKRRKSN